jgi:hypothetical protein
MQLGAGCACQPVGSLTTAIDESILSQFRGARAMELAVILMVIAAKTVGESPGEGKKTDRLMHPDERYSGEMRDEPIVLNRLV